MRLLLSLVCAIFISLALFFGMNEMITHNNVKKEENKSSNHLVYLMEKKKVNIEKKERVKPKKKKVEKIKPKKVKQVKMKIKTKVNKQVKLETFKVTKVLDISSISSLSGAKIEIAPTLLDASMLTPINRIKPRYPRRAKIRKIEGYVNLKFTIDENGYVKDIVVLDSKPKDTFDESAIKALKKSRFKPILEDGVAISKDATITINYRLSK